MKRASYKHGVAWIAGNDEPGETNMHRIKYQISVLLLADLFHVHNETVAADVVFYRNKNVTFTEAKRLDIVQPTGTIERIKAYRNKHDCSLKEAHDAVVANKDK